MVKVRSQREALSYEELRQEKIRKNNEVLHSLGIPKLGTPRKPSTKKAPARMARTVTPRAPSRRSARTLTLKLSAEDAEKRLQEEQAKLAEIERQKEIERRRIPGPIKAEDISQMDSDVGHAQCLAHLCAAAKTSGIGRGVKRGKGRGDKWQIWLNSDDPVTATVKVTPDRIMCGRFHPSPSRPILMFGDKKGKLGLWNSGYPQSMSTDDDDQTYMYSPFKHSLSSITPDPSNGNRIYLSSYDGSIRVLDVQQGVFHDLYYDEEEEGPSLFGVALTRDGSMMVTCTGDGHVVCIDPRQRSVVSTVAVHDGNKVGSVDLHPDTHRLVTASLDRSVCIWDVRRLQGSGKKKTFGEPLLFTGSSRAIQSALFSPSGSHVLATCYEDSVRVFATPDASPKKSAAHPGTLDTSDFTSVNHFNQTGRWITNFRAEWSPHGDEFVIGNMKRALDFFDVRQSKKGSAVVRRGQSLFDEDVITAIPAVNVYHPTLDLIGSGNASGRCHIAIRV